MSVVGNVVPITLPPVVLALVLVWPLIAALTCGVVDVPGDTICAKVIGPIRYEFSSDG